MGLPMSLPLSRPTRISYYLVILLLLATPILLVWQHYGMVRTIEISAREPHGARITDDREDMHGSSVGTLEVTKDAIIMRCAVGGATTYPFCKMQFLLGEPGKGIDLSRFESVTIDARYSGGEPQQLKLHVMNFEPGYSTLGDWNSQRFNEAEIELHPDATTTIPMNVLRTADWWRGVRKIPLSRSYVRLDHVTAVEIATNVAAPGQVVTVELRSIKFRGKWISTTTLLMCLVSAWIACGILGLSMGLLHFRGAYHIYEAARREKARVVFPSSVHAVGLYERTQILDQDCLLRPDGYYGLSKAYGEMLARLYFDKHAVESVLIRIGSVLPEVPDERILSTWISHDDFVRLIERCAAAERVDCSVICGQSNNSRGFWRKDARLKIGWTPLDSSDGQAERVRGKVTDNPVVERYQGGKFIVVDYSRADFPPREMFESE